MITIVCYTGGACGDIITAMIDPTNVEFKNTTVLHDFERQKLKKPHQFLEDEDKDQYLLDISQKYQSVPSHDLDYHCKRGHDFISIGVENFDTALWAASRFKTLHRPHIWEEMQRVCNSSTVEDYAQTLIDYSKMVATRTNKMLLLDDIINGNVQEKLETILQRPISANGAHFYQQWVKLQQT